MYSVASVSVLVCLRFCKQDISKSNLWIFATSIADTPYILPYGND